MSSEARSCINVCGLIAPFMVSAKALTDSLGNIKQSIDKNRKNLRLLAFANEKLEQYTRRDNLRIFKFPACEDGALRMKLIEMASVLGVEIRVTDISTIHHLPSRTPLKIVIVRFNTRHLRNQLLFATKQPLNADECPFKGVYIHEDLTTQRSKLVRFIKDSTNVDRIRSTEGKITIFLKEDKGSGKRISIDNPDDLFKMGIDIAETDLTQFG